MVGLQDDIVLLQEIKITMVSSRNKEKYISGRHLNKVFVSVYVITETNRTPKKYWTSRRGTNPCFQYSGTLLCGRDLKCHIEVQTECSPATMAASTMFEPVIDSEV